MLQMPPGWGYARKRSARAGLAEDGEALACLQTLHNLDVIGAAVNPASCGRWFLGARAVAVADWAGHDVAAQEVGLAVAEPTGEDLCVFVAGVVVKQAVGAGAEALEGDDRSLAVAVKAYATDARGPERSFRRVAAGDSVEVCALARRAAAPRPRHADLDGLLRPSPVRSCR